MNKIFATTAFALTFVAGVVSAQTMTDMNETTCAEFLAMEQLDQESMLSELVAASEGGSLQETTISDVEIVCTGNDMTPVVEVLETSSDD
ncbi:hypothetical protein [Yoonia vestfoldensis]|uniref:hypothetical protein n=1 Tax=Yoonia vestfoldensis TaxID=245188 RepID=UPI000371C324|nr:hypothetical protein [Yoonia vestfoldensis]